MIQNKENIMFNTLVLNNLVTVFTNDLHDLNFISMLQ